MPKNKHKIKYTKRDWVFTIILAATHLLGIIGLSWGKTDDFFITFFPIHIILTAALVLLQTRWGINFFVFLLASVAFIYFAELAAVQTGDVIGSYSYGETLGPAIYDVPVLVTLHWFLLVYGMGVLTRIFKTSKIVKIFTGAVALLVLTAFIEPAAVKHSLWGWDVGGVPTIIFIYRFVLFAVLLSFFNYIRFKKTNPVALSLLIVQSLFYIILYVVN